MMTLNSSGRATTSTESSTTSSRKTLISRLYGPANVTMRGMVPGASFRLATSPSRVSDRMAAQGLVCDTGASCNYCYNR